jgi:DNA helicase-2/ATP-dependent DNA helicase PcrA
MLAGAGTGKTRALTARIAHLLATGTARPNEILAVTFTNKAAREMKNRVGALLGQPAEGMPWLGTFHAICVKLLRRHAELVDLKSNFTILDTDDQVRLMKQLIVAAGIDEKRWPARALASIIDGWKNRALTPDKDPLCRCGGLQPAGPGALCGIPSRLKELNAVDFGDLLLHVIEIFQKNEDLLAQYQRWFRYILVDEYQDTNVAQYLWLRLLAQAHKNICCVGDDDQSIYGWRGAEVGNILRFEKDFPGAYVVRLEQNYRSTGSYPRRRLRRDLGQQGAAGQDAVDRGRGRREGPPDRPLGRRGGGALGRRGDRGDGQRAPVAWIRSNPTASPSSCAPPTRCAPSRTGSSPSAALPRHRRPALLRADGDPGRHGLFPRRGQPR